MERFDQEVFDYEHVRGGRLRVERGIGSPDTVAHLNGMYRQQAPGEQNEVHQLHGYAGVEAQVPGRPLAPFWALGPGPRPQNIKNI